jgi:hypothetical protein
MTVAAALLGYDPSQVKPGWIAFFVVMALVVATFLLWRSMNTQLGKIKVPPRSSFDDTGRAAGDDEGDAADGDDQPPPTR